MFEGFLAIDKEAPTSSKNKNNNKKKPFKPNCKLLTNSQSGHILKPTTKTKKIKKVRILIRQKKLISSNNLIIYLTKFFITN